MKSLRTVNCRETMLSVGFRRSFRSSSFSKDTYVYSVKFSATENTLLWAWNASNLCLEEVFRRRCPFFFTASQPAAGLLVNNRLPIQHSNAGTPLGFSPNLLTKRLIEMADHNIGQCQSPSKPAVSDQDSRSRAVDIMCHTATCLPVSESHVLIFPSRNECKARCYDPLNRQAFCFLFTVLIQLLQNVRKPKNHTQ